MESADLLLVAADGRKLPAHECILRARAPGFYQRHVEATVAAMGRQDGRLREVGDLSRASNRSLAMDESTAELDFHQRGADDRSLEEETPTTGRPPLGDVLASGSYPPSPRRIMTSSTPPYMSSSGTTTSQTVASATTSSTSNPMASSAPVMTSFRDLASGSPMTSSAYSLGGRSEVADIPEEDEEPHTERRHSRGEISMSKFIRLDREEPKDIQKEYLERKRSREGPKQIFPMFIGLTDGDVERAADVPRSGRIIMTKRLSMTSLTSLNSIDMTPTSEAQIPQADRAPCSRLASDLMQMYLNNQDTDVVIRTEGGDLHAHKCILSATCPFFRQQLQKSRRIEMKGYTRNAIHFLLCFLYGGLTSIPDEPCASCVSAVFDALPQFASIRCLKPLYEEALAWQARHFARIWKGRVFGHLNERWQRECYEAIIQHLDDETLIDTILGCERLQIALPRSKSESALAVLLLVDDVLEVAMQFLVHSFHLVVTSRSFQQQGKGLALNLGVLEGLFPSVVHSLSADVAIKTFKGLDDLLEEIKNAPPSPSRALNIPLDEYSPRDYLWNYASRKLLRHDSPATIEATNDRHRLECSSLTRGRPLSTIQQTVTTVETDVQKTEQVVEDSVKERSVERKRERKEESAVRATETKESKVSETSTTTKIRQPSASRQTSKERKSESRSASHEKRTVPAVQERQSSVQDEPEQLKESTSSVSARAESPRTKPRQPETRKSPTKKKAIETEEGKLERQGTHTIMNVDRGKGVELPGPGPSPTKTVEKPKSVVKPMLKDPPLASTTQRTVTRSVPLRTARETKPSPTVKSSIPKSVTSTPTKVAPSRPPARIPPVESKPKVTLTRTGRSPKPGRKTTNSIEK
ncbi:BTB/POZ domain protein [Ancylostoma ceylanicum]|uniref:BTB/POZ domain protein n=1 Tax=Ancylostoma ceylanicum TaxID=53326 RepID=A0A0D6M2C6_9BILA|nr:BTB/POZ domain protein [Ancylostoma ceylanicum]